jgi:hypothetical protein
MILLSLITKIKLELMAYEAMSLQGYALSIENAGGNNDTKCLYFPFCLDQAPLTWLESLEKYSIDKWDQLKE